LGTQVGEHCRPVRPLLLVNSEEYRQAHGRSLIPEPMRPKPTRAAPPGPKAPASAEQTAQRAKDVAVERAVDVAEQLERLAGAAAGADGIDE